MTKHVLFAAMLFTFSSCGTKYLMVSEGESFDVLTKITDEKKVCLLPHGGEGGKNLVFAAREDDGSYNIYMKDNVLASSLIQKTNGQNRNVFPSYNANSGRIAFQYYASNNFDIYYINATSGKAITQVTSTPENEYNPCWSSDGKMIVFEKGAPPRSFITYKSSGKENKLEYQQGVQVTENQIWIKDLVTGELKMIGNGSFPKFSPDDKEVVFVKYELNRKKSAEIGTIWSMSVDGDNQKQITGPDLGYASYPNWSPDGRFIVFQLTKDSKEDADIYTIGADGDHLMQHTLNKSADFAPYWTKDNFLYFTSDRGNKAGGYMIYRFKINVN